MLNNITAASGLALAVWMGGENGAFAIGFGLLALVGLDLHSRVREVLAEIDDLRSNLRGMGAIREEEDPEGEMEAP